MADYTPSYTPALSVMQPWCWLLVHRFKKIENRSRRVHYRGPVLLHAGQKMDNDAHEDLMHGRHPVTGNIDPVCAEYQSARTFGGARAGEVLSGGIVGICDIVDCVDVSDDPYFVGPFGWVIANARPLRFQPCRGMLGLFDPKIIVDMSEVT